MDFSSVRQLKFIEEQCRFLASSSTCEAGGRRTIKARELAKYARVEQTLIFNQCVHTYALYKPLSNFIYSNLEIFKYNGAYVLKKCP